MAPELENLKKEYAGALEVEFVDVWKRPQDAEAYKVRAIPTQIFYDANGKELGRHLGFISKDDILAKFKSLGIVIVKADTKRK
jgi:thioredoxin 1